MTEHIVSFHKNAGDMARSSANTASPEQSASPGTCVDAEPFALQVLDESMSPEFWKGCIIVVDPTGVATDGSYVLAIDPVATQQDAEEAAYVFRQLRKFDDGGWYLTALQGNTDTSSIANLEQSIVGVIVQRAGTRRHHRKHY